MKLNRIEKGKYETDDGRFKVEYDFREEPCFDAHPVQISRKNRDKIREALAEHNYSVFETVRYGQSGFTRDEIEAVAERKKGYYCAGEELHLRYHWLVWDNEINDYAGGQGVQIFETKKEAVQWMAEKFYGIESESSRRMREAMDAAYKDRMEAV